MVLVSNMLLKNYPVKSQQSQARLHVAQFAAELIANDRARQPPDELCIL